jgi:hypothetical protein
LVDVEDRDDCFEVCYHVFVRFGLPGALYLDRASQFITTRILSVAGDLMFLQKPVGSLLDSPRRPAKREG